MLQLARSVPNLNLHIVVVVIAIKKRNRHSRRGLPPIMSRAISNCKDTTFFQTGKIYFLMSSTKSLWQQLLHDIQVELTEEFDRNFERKAFFDRPWRPRRSERSGRGSLMNVTGKCADRSCPRKTPPTAL